MTLRTTASAILMSTLLALPATLAQAQSSPSRPTNQAISMDDARRIAKDNGVVRIEEIELDDGKWEIEGRDAAGAEIEIDLRATDGMVIKMERDRPAAARAQP